MTKEMKDEKRETLRLFTEYRARQMHLKDQNRDNIWDQELSELETKIHNGFHSLFDHWAMKEYIITCVKYSGADVSIDKVCGEGSDIEPKDIIDLYDQLKTLDDALKSGQLKYIYHMVTEQDYYCTQMWLAEPELAAEYQSAYGLCEQEESNKWRYIPRELFILAPFLDKYQQDERLIELWSGPF